MVKFRLISMGDGSDYRVEWYELPQLLDIDQWVEDTLGKSERDSFFSTVYSGGSCVADFQYEVKHWVQHKKDVLDELLEQVDELYQQLVEQEADVSSYFWIIKEDEQ